MGTNMHEGAVSSRPKVSVVMAVYNEQPYLEKAVQSVLDQTFGDFEFIIVNDGSTDGSKEVLEWFKGVDDRIQLVHQENRGRPASLNRAIEVARGEYIARMDGDDISHPKRFERQVQYLDENPKVGILGTQVKKIDADGVSRWRWSLPTNPDVIAWRLLFNTCICHPTIMARRSIILDLDGYSEWASHADDYELWSRAVLETRIANLQGRFLKFRRHEDAVTVKKREEQIRICAEAAATLHRAILGSSADEQIARFLVWMDTKSIEEAIRKTGVKDFSSIHEYLHVLYKKCAHRFFRDGSNTRIQRRALRKLDTVANKVLKYNGTKKGVYYKVKSWYIIPLKDIILVVMESIISRLKNNFKV